MFPFKSRPAFILALAAAAAIGVSAYSVSASRASDHQDAPLTVSRPGADITDVYVFPDPQDGNRVVLAMNVWPLIPKGMGTSASFDPGVLYQLKIGTGDHYKEDYVIQFKATGVGTTQQIAVSGPAVPATTGVTSTLLPQIGTVAYNAQAMLPGGVRVFAGPREDPFFFDLTQFYAIQPDRNFANQPSVPSAIAGCFRSPGTDFLAGFNVLSLVVDLPRALLADVKTGRPGFIHVWATASIPSTDASLAPNAPLAMLASVTQHVNAVLTGNDAGPGGTYTQVERLGRPAIKEATENYANHDATNRSTITDDGVLARSIYTYVTVVAHRSPRIANALTKLLIPDAIEADLSAPGPARYLAVETNGKSGLPVAVVRLVPVPLIYGVKRSLGDPYRMFGGRDLGSPVIDLSLGAIYGSLLPKLGLAPDDGNETPCLTSDHTTPAAKHFLASFPFIGDPR
jgi:hypothetical protein